MEKPLLTLFGRHDCPLCDEALDMAKILQKEFSFELKEFNITTDLDVFEKYKETIPVFALDGNVCLRSLFDEGDLRQALIRRGVPQK